MIPDHHLTVREAADHLEVSERRVRDLIASGDIAGVRVGQRQWAAERLSVVDWATAHPRAGRRLTLESQWALICELGNGSTDWITTLVRHRTRKRIAEWTPEQIADAVSPAVRSGWPPWIGPQTRRPDLRVFEHATSAEQWRRAFGLQQLAEDVEFWRQSQRWHWWHDRGVEYDDFWGAPDIPADGQLPDERASS
jgi:excisionase family DNA binding protein